jgi:diguanylate cyclase (GGDEF)-like protein
MHGTRVFVRQDDAMSQTVLLIEDNSPSADLVKQALLGPCDGSLVVERVRKCSEAQERLCLDDARPIAAVVANLFLPDSQGLQTMARIFEVSPYMPILVLTTADNEPVARQAVQQGAQDYVLQHRLDNYLLPKVLQNMLYRAANTEALRLQNARSRIALDSVEYAVYDHLTGLPDRLLLDDRLAQAIASARRLQQSLAVLCVDVDRFKHVNFALGNKIGDQLLCSIAERLVGGVRATDTVSRHRGDAFMLVLPGLAHADDATLGAQKILASLSMPYSIDDHNLQVTATIGIAVYPDDGADAPTLLKNAAMAMSNAKQQGHNRYGFCKPHMNELAIERQFLESGLRRALKRHEFALHYQPQVDLRTQAIVGAEASVRWCRPTRGMALSGEFMPVAERSGSIIQIGLWALREACRQSNAWRDAGLASIPVALSVSAVELRAAGFVESVGAILRETAMEPQHLVLDIKELALTNDCKSTVRILGALKDIGVRLALEHFGTGASSLTHLMRFPVDTLRIDESLVRGIGNGDENSAIVNAVISAGISFRLRVSARGIDTRKQFLALRRLNCHQGQGRYFREAVAGGEFTQLLKDGCATLAV